MSGYLEGWRLSAGDEQTVFDGDARRVAQIACGGMSGRTFAESADVARLIAAAPELLATLECMVATLDAVKPMLTGNQSTMVKIQVRACREIIAKATPSRSMQANSR